MANGNQYPALLPVVERDAAVWTVRKLHVYLANMTCLSRNTEARARKDSIHDRYTQLSS